MQKSSCTPNMGVNQSVISRRLRREGEAPAEPLENRLNLFRLGRSLALPERPRFGFGCGSVALCSFVDRFFLELRGPTLRGARLRL